MELLAQADRQTQQKQKEREAENQARMDKIQRRLTVMGDQMIAQDKAKQQKIELEYLQASLKRAEQRELQEKQQKEHRMKSQNDIKSYLKKQMQEHELQRLQRKE